MKNKENQNGWFRNWFDENYLELYKHRDENDAQKQINLIVNSLNLNKSTRILDLGCGQGRHLAILNNMGYRVFGLDISRVLINRAKTNHPHLNLIIGDMREIPGCFDVILSLFTSFGYFDHDMENMKVIFSISSALIKNGWFWLDFLNPPFIEKNIINETITRISPNQEICEKRKIDNGRIIKDITIIQNDKRKHYLESVKLYSRQILEQIMTSAGISPLGCYGSYSGSDWSESSERTIIFGKKSGD